MLVFIGFWAGGVMKKISLIFIVGLMLSSSIFQVHAARLKLGCLKNKDERKTEIPTISQNFPASLIPHLEQYLTVNNDTSIAFTSNKKEAGDFDVEEVIRTTLGSVYYRITYQGAVLIWDKTQKQFKLISNDEKINPLKKQIQWLSLLKWCWDNSRSKCNKLT